MGKTETSAIFMKGNFVIYINSLSNIYWVDQKFCLVFFYNILWENPNELFGQHNIFFNSIIQLLVRK